MPGKILFFEDEINQYGSEILSALYESNCISEPVYDECMKEKEKGNPWSNDLFNNHLNAAAIDLVGSTFMNAIAKIESIGKGKEYSLIFIDRNLENYGDIKKQRESESGIDGFSKNFFDFFDNFVGDYLYFRLVQNGVPPEKILFLTANPNEEFKAAPFIKFSKEQIIVKSKRLETSDSGNLLALTPSDEGNEEEQETETQLKKVLVDRGQDTVTRNKYNDIFNSKKIEELFEGTDLLDKFLQLLTEMRLGENIEDWAGTTLRLMIEQIVHAISSSSFDESVRHFLNNPNAEYMQNFKVDADKEKCEKYAEYLNSSEKDKFTSAQKQVFKKYTTDLLITYFTIVFSSPYNDNQAIPKYIYSFIDNIYTTTSECSMHGGGNDIKKLTKYGWYALLNGMCEVLFWYQKPKKRFSAKILSLDMERSRGKLIGNILFSWRDLNEITFNQLKEGDILEYEIERKNQVYAKKIRRISTTS